MMAYQPELMKLVRFRPNSTVASCASAPLHGTLMSSTPRVSPRSLVSKLVSRSSRNLTLTGEYRDVLGRPAHRVRDARLVPHLLDTTASIESRLLGGTALRVLGRRLQS